MKKKSSKIVRKWFNESIAKDTARRTGSGIGSPASPGLAKELCDERARIIDDAFKALAKETFGYSDSVDLKASRRLQEIVDGLCDAINSAFYLENHWRTNNDKRIKTLAKVSAAIMSAQEHANSLIDNSDDIE